MNLFHYRTFLCELVSGKVTGDRAFGMGTDLMDDQTDSNSREEPKPINPRHHRSPLNYL